MSTLNVNYQIYAADGVTPVYLIPFPQKDNSPQDPQSYTEIQSLRGTGSIILPGSIQSWDMEIDFYLQGINYQALMAQVDSLLTTVVMQTKYVISITRSASTTVNYNCMRLKPVQISSDDFRTGFMLCKIILRINCW